MNSPSSEKQREMSLVLALVAVALAFCFHLVGETFAEWFLATTHHAIPTWVSWLLELSSPIFFFGVLSELFEKHLWKMQAIRTLVQLDTPMIAGTWNAEFRSSYDNYQTVYSAKAIISQSWSKVSLTLRADKSHSSSEVAAIIVDSSGEKWLVYEYLNEPKNDAIGTMNSHRGTCRLAIKGELIEGDYYTGRGRFTNGTLILSRLK